MKYLFFFSLVLTALCVNAQDSIYSRAGNLLVASVEEISETHIKYKRPDNPDGPLYSINKTDIAVIKYRNHTSETFSQTKSVLQINYENPCPPQNRSLILMPGVMKEKEVLLVLKEKNDDEIDRLLTKMKLCKGIQPVGFVAIPAGVLGFFNLAGSASSDHSTINTQLAQQNTGLGFLALSVVCLSSGIYFKVERNKNYKKAIRKYNQLYN